jgi:ATP-dependent protease ClpP protease subunit
MSTQEVVFDPMHSVIVLRGPVSPETVLQVQDLLDLATGYYQHEHVTLRLNSPGGQANCLAYLLGHIERLRDGGIAIDTSGEITVASAAAVLLAMGTVGQRTVQPCTELLFHDARVNGAGEQTQKTSAQIAARLSQLTLQVVRTIAGHVERGSGGVQPAAEEGLARLGVMAAAKMELERRLPTAAACFPARVQAAIDAMWRKCLREGSTQPYVQFLGRRFAADAPMDLREAYALLLVDRVAMCEVFAPRSRSAHAAPSEPVPCMLAA